ncbi:MAG TPA: TolC family protein [Pyrinomonadaceae bacterium]|jgi:HAE1 family hydrophobic/amphiphilic exporter-1
MNRILYTVVLSLVVCFTAGAQTPTTPNPAQQDATRPPGTERRGATPEQSRPDPSNPTVTPGTERPTPQSPPGVNTFPQATPTRPAITPPTELAQPPAAPNTGQENSGATSDANQEAQPSHPLPPLPPLSRLGVESGETLTLTLNEAIRRALEHNTEIEVARVGVRVTESNLRALEGVYEPVFQITPQLSSFVTPQSSTLGGSNEAGTVSQTLIDFGPSVTKLFRTGGGQYQVFFNNTRETTSSSFAQISPAYSGNLGLTFTQPLWRDRRIDNNRRQIRVQRKRLAQSDADFRRQTIDVITQVQRAYWELVFALRDQQNRIASLNLIRTQFMQTEQRIEAGSIAPVARAEVQTELSNREADVLEAVQNVSVAENNLKRLLLPDSRAAEWAAALVPVDQTTPDSATPVNLRDALEEARTNRPELRRVQLQQEITDIDISYFKNQTRPRLDLQATVSTTGLAGSPVTPTGSVDGGQADTVPSNLLGGYGRMLRNLATLGTRNIVVGVRLELPLHNKTAQANLATAEMQREQLAATMHGEELNIEVEVRNAAQAAETARLRVLAARESRENAEVQLRAEKNLYQVGRSTTFLLFQRENQLTNARNIELRAETNYNQALADLQRATSTTLRANNVIVETPLAP